MTFLRTLPLIALLIPLHAQTQVGGGTCATSTLNGIYFYLLGGSVISGGQVLPYAELGELTADGQGGVTGQSQASLSGSQSSHSLRGTYSVQGNCSGNLSLIVDSQPAQSVSFSILNGGLGAVVAFSQPDEVIVGRAYRQTAQSGSVQCGQGSISGSYGYLLAGTVNLPGGLAVYSNAGSVVSNGSGALATSSLVNVEGSTAEVSTTGSYSIAGDCAGTAQLIQQSVPYNYLFAVVDDGQVVLFIETDAGTTVSGSAQPQFSAPQTAVVNAASFAPRALSPGALFSIFGSGFSQQTASAAAIPLPATLASTQVRVNGEVAPLLYVSPNQINAQMPLDVSTTQPVPVSVTNGATQSNAVTVSVSPGAPGIFEYGQNRAIVQNSDYSLNSDANPAHPGGFVIAYLTGGGPVTPAGPLATGGPAPNGASPTTLNYSISVAGLSAII